jgi:hypothetical protein
MVKLFEEEIHIMQLFYANQSIRNVRDISNALAGLSASLRSAVNLPAAAHKTSFLLFIT